MSEPDRTTAHATDTAHVAEGLALLTQQLRGKPVTEALLTTWLTQVQEIEDALWELYALTITTSEDHALDQLGVILGMPRPEGMADAAYRLVLDAVVIALRSSGTGDEILRAMRALIGSYSFAFTETFPASVLLEPDTTPAVPTAVMLAVLRRVKSGGVGLQVVDVPSGDTFAFSSYIDADEADASRGWSTTAGLVGGKLVGVMS